MKNGPAPVLNVSIIYFYVVGASSLKIKSFGHSFFRLGFGKTSVVVDPFIHNYDSSPRHVPLVKPHTDEEGVGRPDIILVTHEHFDHFDKQAIETLAKEGNTMVVGHHSLLSTLNLPANCLKPVQAGQKFSLRGLDISTVAVHHPSSFYPLGYVVGKDGVSVFHPGDTSLLDKFLPVAPSVALFPIGGWSTMDVIDAVKATKTMKPDVAVPMHYNTFESIRADPQDFAARIEKSNIKTNPMVLKPGQSFNF
ncbi:MAG: MBL fold metallo-hydrolase [Candidatus Diapherotrites archaeon]|nr:MBL fold metallo-hydrolase [Candidatus Diapherotrites archaeon]